MEFIQFIEFSTDRIDEVRALQEQWESATQGQRTPVSSILVQDRNAAEWYVAIVTFPSYAEAQRNNELPATQEFAQKLSGLCKEGPKFCDLDVIERRDLTTAGD